MEIGQIVNGKYEILALIGKGGMSEVYLAKDIVLNKEWAIKKIEKSCERSVVYESMLMEAKMISSLNHHSIPRITDIIETSTNLIIVMDYIQGNNLDKILRESQKLSESFVIDVALQLIDVLKYIHSQNVIYRDLKPINIMIQPNGKIKLIDFGIARKFSPEKLSDTVCLGTVGYAAPEQYGGRGQTDYRVDVYAFGVTLFYMLTGINPILHSLDLSAVGGMDSELSYFFEQTIRKCTQLNPNDRYQSFYEIEQAFENRNIFGRHKNRWLVKKKNERKSKQLINKNDIYRLQSPKEENTITSLLYEVPLVSNYNETTILSVDDVDSYIPSSVLDDQKVSVFLSYCHCDGDLADVIYGKLSNYDYITISRYTTDVPYKGSFIEFMNSLKEHDKVIMIVSDQYLKSRACMYEVGQLVNSPNFESKILFILCSENDKKYYKILPKENIEAKIYSLHDRNQYIIFWEEQCKVLKRDLEIIEDESAKIETLKTISDIKHLISNDISRFMKYIAEVNGVTFDELYKHDFREFFKELGINDV